MTLTQHAPPRTGVTDAAKRIGYAIAVGVNAVMLYVVNNLLAWEVPAFLTEEFERVLPVLNISIVASIVVNLMYVAYDAPWFKSLGQVVLSAIALVATIRTLEVFPFDFARYDFNWEVVARGCLILATVAIVIGLITETVKLVTRLASPPSS
jgi:hypothetical protein